jgi:hypothetical protein
MAQGGHMLEKVLSGGQAGVDRAALDVAIEMGLPHGGWCPAGRAADDGIIPEKYQLIETAEIDHTVRTERNVREADATLMIYRGALHGGTAYAIEMAKHLHKPVMAINLDLEVNYEEVLSWLKSNNVKILYVGGRRESKNPGIYFQSRILLNKLFHELLKLW